ncbi:MAG: cyclase family protein [Bdellovibrionota bacterium]
MGTVFLSHFINENSPNFGGTKGIEINQVRSIDRGDTSNKLEFKTTNHFGTHIDFPKHFILGGKSLNAYEASDFVFEKPFLAEIPLANDELLTSKHFAQFTIPNGCDFLIVKTGFERFRGQESYWKNNPGLTPELGSHLKNKFPSIRCIGFDFISATAFQHREIGREAHKAFLGDDCGSPILLLEDMKLSLLKSNPRTVIVAPLMIDEADGTQVTVIALT